MTTQDFLPTEPATLVTDESLATYDADDDSEILAIHKWRTNGYLLWDCARLGLIKDTDVTLDCTYGYGEFWSVWSPRFLVATDLNPDKSPSVSGGMDCRYMPYDDRAFDAVVFDPPYKLNGTPDDDIDERYGVDTPTHWTERMQLIRDGARECARVCDRALFVKVQDQVVCSVIRWQTIAVAEEIVPQGFGLRARFDFLGRRAQPEGRTQRNPYSCSSQLLVFQRGWQW